MKGIYICRICNKSFPSKCLCRAKKRSHSKFRSDSKCSTTIKTESSLSFKDHCDLDKSDEKKPFVCGICKNLFPRYDLLSHHNVLKHPHLVKIPLNSLIGRKIDVARKCGTKGSRGCGTSGKKSASHKMNDLQMNENLAYKCQICHKGFRVYSNLWNHAWVHTEAKPYVCTVCGKGFGRLYRLKYHATIHSNDRPYKCLLCLKSYKLKGTLTKHEQSHKSLICRRPAKGDHNKDLALKRIYNYKIGSQLVCHKRQTKHAKPGTFPKIEASTDCQNNKFAQYCSMHGEDCCISQMNGKAGKVLSSGPKRSQFKAACEKISDILACENDLDMFEDAFLTSQLNSVQRLRSRKENIFPISEDNAVCKLSSVTSCANITAVNSSGHEIESKIPFKVNTTRSKATKKCNSSKPEKVCASSISISKTSVNSLTDNDDSVFTIVEIDEELLSVSHKCASCSQVFKHHSSLIRHIKRLGHSYDKKLSLSVKKADAGKVIEVVSHVPAIHRRQSCLKSHKCASCSQVFKHQSSLIRHIKRLGHSYDKKLSLSVKKADAGKVIEVVSDVPALHRRQSCLKSHKCASCSQVFKHHSSLIRHIKRLGHSYDKKLSLSVKKADAGKVIEVVSDVPAIHRRQSCLKSQNISKKKVSKRVSFCLDELSGYVSNDVYSTTGVAKHQFESVDCFSVSMANSYSQQVITHSVKTTDHSIDLQDMPKNSNTDDCSLEQAACSFLHTSAPIEVSRVPSECFKIEGMQTFPNITCDMKCVPPDSQAVSSDLSNLVGKAPDLIVWGRDIPFSEETVAENVVSDKEKKRLKDIKFKCNYCSKGYTALSSLKRHLKVHSNVFISENRSTLELADHTPNTAENANKNRKALNLHQKLFKCEVCERRYSRLRTLMNHTTKQSCQRPHQCTFCKKKFKSKFILKQHMLVEFAKIQNNELKCENCKVVFSSKRDLELHKVDSVCKTCGERIFCKYLHENHSCQLFEYLPRSGEEPLVVRENVSEYPSDFGFKESNRIACNAPGTSHFEGNVYNSNYFGRNPCNHTYFDPSVGSKSTDLLKFKSHFLEPADSFVTNTLCCADLPGSSCNFEQSSRENSNSNTVCDRNVKCNFNNQIGNQASVSSNYQSNSSFEFIMQRQLIGHLTLEAFQQNTDDYVETYNAHEAYGVTSINTENTYKMQELQNLSPGCIMSNANGSDYESQDETQSVHKYSCDIYAKPDDLHHQCSVCGCLFATATELTYHEEMHF